MSKLESYRKRIDTLDDEIIDLLNQRFTLTEAVGLYKKKTHINVEDTNREQAILNKITHYKYHDALSVIYQTLFTLSKKAQRK